MTEDNPESILTLIKLLNLPDLPKAAKYSDVKKGRVTKYEYEMLRDIRTNANRERKMALKPYRVGSCREYEGDGYFIKPLYLYEGKYYA